MGLIQEIFRTHGPHYLARFGSAMPHSHKKVVEAIMGCRTETNGCVLYQCEDCAEAHLVPRCCGNRHCPGCQQHKAYAWLARQLERQLPTHYFMLTFTVPEPLRPFIRRHQRIAYGALFDTSASSIKKLAADPKRLGADTPGFFGVLHTWGRCLQYHPHIHYVVPGGAFDSQTRYWHASSTAFFLPVRALSIIFRSKFRDAMAEAGLLQEIPAHVWRIDWNVNCQPVGQAEASLKYLARYVFKVAISERRIVGVDTTHVRFQYRQVNSNRVRIMRLPIREFLHRFLQHVLPAGFMKVRHYGFLSPSCSMPIEEVKARIEMARGFVAHAPEVNVETPAPKCCRHCGGRLRYQRMILPPRASLIGAMAQAAAAVAETRRPMMRSAPASG
jgi:Putative transposase/Transposase zinc-binding domain